MTRFGIFLKYFWSPKNDRFGMFFEIFSELRNDSFWDLFKYFRSSTNYHFWNVFSKIFGAATKCLVLPLKLLRNAHFVRLLEPPKIAPKRSLWETFRAP